MSGFPCPKHKSCLLIEYENSCGENYEKHICYADGKLKCNDMKLTSLIIPNGFINVDCSNNQLISLVVLKGATAINCSSNPLKFLELPEADIPISKLQYYQVDYDLDISINCSNNLLESLKLPEGIMSLTYMNMDRLKSLIMSRFLGSQYSHHNLLYIKDINVRQGMYKEFGVEPVFTLKNICLNFILSNDSNLKKFNAFKLPLEIKKLSRKMVKCFKCKRKTLKSLCGTRVCPVLCLYFNCIGTRIHICYRCSYVFNLPHQAINEDTIQD